MMKALKKLRVCLRTSATEEELPLFHSPPAGYAPSMKPRTEVLPLPRYPTTMLGKCCMWTRQDRGMRLAHHIFLKETGSAFCSKRDKYNSRG